MGSVRRRWIWGLWLIPALAWAQEAAGPGPAPEFRYFRYERAVASANDFGPQVEHLQTMCANLGPEVFEHAAPALKDLRVFRGQVQVPYVVTVSQPAETGTEPAKVMNIATHGSHIGFDLEMPTRPYSEIDLDLDGHDFVAEAESWGEQQLGGARAELGWSRVFDFTSQRLSRRTVLVMQESSWPFVHVELSVERAPGAKADPAVTVRGASIPPSREEQSVFNKMEETGVLVQRGTQTVATLHVPAHVPVEWVMVGLNAPVKDFKRTVQVRAWTDGAPESQAEMVTGEVSSVHLPPWPGRINLLSGRDPAFSLGFPAVLGANLQSAATVEVAIENGDQPPLPLKKVDLLMRNRRVCFDGGPATLFYGDPVLHAPAYRYSLAKDEPAQLGPETHNPDFVARLEDRNYAQRHPEMIGVLVLAVVCLLGVIVIHHMRKQQVL